MSRQLRKKQPDLGVIEILKEAEATPESQQTAEPAPRLRREHRLLPDQQPLDWFTTFEKYNDAK